MTKNVITRGRELLATGRITTAYAPTLSEACRKLEVATESLTLVREKFDIASVDPDLAKRIDEYLDTL